VQETTIEDRCAALSEEWGLTKREQEIFVMLARGRNVAYIQDHYTISRNTVKSHIKHIYAKLGVHSHQELIDLVEGAPARKE
jgi:DNA-binding CsgD family transcriptional regulator